MAADAEPRQLSGGGTAARQAIIEAVVQVAGRDGFASLTYRQVAREAGVSHGLVQYHFGSLDEAVLAAHEWVFREAISHSPLGGESPDEFAASLSRFVAENPEQVAFQWGLILRAQQQPELLAQIRHFNAQYVAQVEQWLLRLGIAQDPALAQTVFAMLNGIVLSQFVSHDPGQTDKEIALLRALLERLNDQPELS